MFSRDRLTCYANNARTGVVPALYFYYNAEADTVTEAGYMKDNRLAVNDLVTVMGADHSVVDYYVSAVANGAATLVEVA